MAALPTVVSFWRGPVTWIERLCVASMRAPGHRVEVFSYEPEALSRVGLECEVRDARDVIAPPDDIPSHNLGTLTAEAVLSDVFRLALLKQERGLWCDMDCLFIRQVDFDGEIFGWERPGSIANGVLRLSAQSPALNEFIRFSQKRPIVCPWWSLEKAMRMRAHYWLTRTSTLPRGAPPFGPRALTYFLEKHGRLDAALAREVFYPVHYSKAGDLVDPADPVTPILTERSRIVHLWHSLLFRIPYPPPTSFLGKQIKRYGL